MELKVLVANRGEIACRILKTLSELGVRSVAVASELDRDAPHVWLADEVVMLDTPLGYLDPERILQAASETGASALHPGYGFLAESASFASACRTAGLTFIGPSAEAMQALGDKRRSRETALAEGVPVVPGRERCDSLDEARTAAQEVGFPLLVKAAAGGGGKGMRRIDRQADLGDAFEAARREAEAAFGDGRLLIEKLVHPARHIEVQVLGDGRDAVALGERECSLQRRYQKVIEESPSPAVDSQLRGRMAEAAVKLARAVGYSNAGTVEFLLGPDGQFYFLEVNTRLQVEHPVTEFVTGLDLVRCQIELAHGGSLPEPPVMRGHAIEARLNAEDAYNRYLPQTGEVVFLSWPERPSTRIDSGIAEGSIIGSAYDSLLAKVIAAGSDREMARQRLVAALRSTTLLGLKTNQSFLIDVLDSELFKSGQMFTTSLEEQEWPEPLVPEHVRELAEQTLARRSGIQHASEGGDMTDRHSPWRELGGFRMGQRA